MYSEYEPLVPIRNYNEEMRPNFYLDSEMLLDDDDGNASEEDDAIRQAKLKSQERGRVRLCHKTYSCALRESHEQLTKESKRPTD